MKPLSLARHGAEPDSVAIRGSTASPILIDAVVSLLMAAVSLALYVWLGQSALNADAVSLLLRFLDNNDNVGYLKALRLLRHVSQPFGLTLYETALLFSQVGASAGIALLYVAGRITELSRPAACLAALGVALCPSVVFFATQVEMPAPFLPFAGAGWVAVALMARRPTYARAVAVAVTAGVAVTAHASGAFLALPLVLFFLAQTWRRPVEAVPARSRLIIMAAVTLALDLLIACAIAIAARSFGFSADPGAALGFVVAAGVTSIQTPLRLIAVVWHEWLVPFFPVSLLWLCAIRAYRPHVCALGVSLAGYCVASFLVLIRAVEHGAYLQPLAWPACWLTVRTLPRRWAVVTVALLALLSTATLARDDHARDLRIYANGVKTLSGGAAASLLVGDIEEVAACLVHLPDTRFLCVLDPSFARKPPDVQLELVDSFIVRGLAVRANVYLTVGAEAWMSHPSVVAMRPGIAQLLGHLRNTYRWQFVSTPGFMGKRLLGRR